MQRQASAVLLSLILCASAARAQAPDDPRIVRGLCQKDGCAEFAILDQQPLARGPDGTLVRTRVETFHASYGGRVSGGEENGYVYCSPTRPAVISTPPGRPAVAFRLAPDEASPAYVLRKSTNFFAIYFGVCHGVEAGRAAARDRAGTARSFGYHVALDRSGPVPLGRAEDYLKPSP